ncbi:threonine synthase [Luteolibacter pohnpeiensis]|uniref:Threonine synthase n=1 Tax=Luteolibacter pohnpeiensis TaxID=454153 RepID=A0A934S5L9_9BACT|nr:threonine synthase [Luteolibacter pohnpeiensis]MBK1881191.1 threonine synthase [Luteolibacter pohnpeiensis]
MLYHSTNNPSHQVGLKEAILRSLPPDNGLYMPDQLPVLSSDFWTIWRHLSFQEMGFAVADAFFGEDVPAAALREIVEGTLTFDAPLTMLAPGDFILELFHGPTLAFKDFGARFMARLMAWLTRDDDQELTVLVATSGDTGGAVASAFHHVPGTRVVILYPKGKVSGLQEKQLTTLGGNITALEVDGSFDDCQAMVKSAFLDQDLARKFNLTSANSINLSRLVPQSFYYIYSASQLPEGVNPVFVVPSGNFGNLTAGLLAAQLGLPVEHFIAATNRNDVVPRYLRSGNYEPHPSIATISNAMDVGSPSNFVRMQALTGNSWDNMKSRIHGVSFSDEQTRAAIREVKSMHDYELDPHGAVAWLAARQWRATHAGHPTLSLETAHPAKFIDVMETELGPGSVEIPERLAVLADREKSAIPISNEAAALHQWLRDTLS